MSALFSGHHVVLDGVTCDLVREGAYAELLAQRDALLKACEALLDHMAGDVEIAPDHPVVQGVYVAAKNAGAKVREPYMYGLKGKPE